MIFKALAWSTLCVSRCSALLAVRLNRSIMQLSNTKIAKIIPTRFHLQDRAMK